MSEHAAILTTCMGRLEFLKQALPTWLTHTEMSVLVVAYACPETAAYVRGLRNARVWLAELEASSHMEGKPLFNKCEAINRGLRELSTARRSRVLLLDADTVMLKPVALSRDYEELTIVDPSHATRELTGVLSADTHLLLYAGGANEAMNGYGVEDLDLRLRLYLRAAPRVSFFDEAHFRPLEHDDELRTKNYALKTPALSSRLNLSTMLSGLTPLEIERMKTDPLVPTLLGSALAR